LPNFVIAAKTNNMRIVNVFNFVTLNGFYAGVNGDISWHKHGADEGKFSEEGAQSGSTLLFGRITYEMMASFWPTPMAIQNYPVVADGMNKAEKIVFSRTLKNAEWNNTRVVSDNMVEEVKKLKQSPGVGLTILGSGSIITQLADEGLIDQYQIMIDPVAIGEGVPLFKNLKHRLDLKLTSTRTFNSGVVLLNYEPVRK
jgi:dihydrofolate reductase